MRAVALQYADPGMQGSDVKELAASVFALSADEGTRFIAASSVVRNMLDDTAASTDTLTLDYTSPYAIGKSGYHMWFNKEACAMLVAWLNEPSEAALALKRTDIQSRMARFYLVTLADFFGMPALVETCVDALGREFARKGFGVFDVDMQAFAVSNADRRRGITEAPTIAGRVAQRRRMPLIQATDAIKPHKASATLAAGATACQHCGAQTDSLGTCAHCYGSVVCSDACLAALGHVCFGVRLSPALIDAAAASTEPVKNLLAQTLTHMEEPPFGLTSPLAMDILAAAGVGTLRKHVKNAGAAVRAFFAALDSAVFEKRHGLASEDAQRAAMAGYLERHYPGYIEAATYALAGDKQDMTVLKDEYVRVLDSDLTAHLMHWFTVTADALGIFTAANTTSDVALQRRTVAIGTARTVKLIKRLVASWTHKTPFNPKAIIKLSLEIDRSIRRIGDRAEDDRSVISLACATGELDVVNYWLAQGVDPWSPDYDANPPAEEAIDHPHILRRLLALPNVRPEEPDHRLIMAVVDKTRINLESLNLLMADRRVSPEAENNAALAAAIGTPAAVRILLADRRVAAGAFIAMPRDSLARSYGRNVSMTDADDNDDRSWALVHAAMRVPANLTADPGYLVRVIEKRYHRTLLVMLRSGLYNTSRVDYALLRAMVGNDAAHPIVRLLLDFFPAIDPSVEDNTLLVEACTSASVNMVQVLLSDARVEPTAATNRALLAAMEHNRQAPGHIARLLLADARVDPNLGHPIELALRIPRNSLAVAEFLKHPRIAPRNAFMEALLSSYEPGLLFNNQVHRYISTNPHVRQLPAYRRYMERYGSDPDASAPTDVASITLDLEHPPALVNPYASENGTK